MAFWNIFKKKSGEEMLLAGDKKGALAAFEAELGKKKEVDPQLMLKVADLHNKLGNQDAAKDYYVKLGTHYGEIGFFNKSVAVFKKALNISPDDETILAALSGFNDMVPKFMVNDALLKKKKPASEEPSLEAEPGPEPELPKVEVDPDLADALIDFEEDTGNYDPEAFQAKQAERVPAAQDDEEDEELNALDGDDEEIFDPTSDDAATSPESEVKTRTNSGMKFTSHKLRETASKSQPADNAMNFDSFDDALDSIFMPGAMSQPEPEPEPEPEPDHYLIPEEQFDEELDSRHWPLFRTMESDHFLEFVQALESRDYDADQVIVKQGDSGSEMFFIAYGNVDVLIEKDGGSLKVAELTEGDIFGEASLISGQPRNATVIAKEPTNCLMLNRKDLGRLSRSNSEIMANIKSIYYTRIQQNAAEKQS